MRNVPPGMKTISGRPATTAITGCVGASSCMALASSAKVIAGMVARELHRVLSGVHPKLAGCFPDTRALLLRLRDALDVGQHPCLLEELRLWPVKAEHQLEPVLRVGRHPV